MNRILNAVEQLKIRESDLKFGYKQLKGIRQIIQLESPDYTVCISKTQKPDIFTHGITNRCQDAFYIFFAEYDQIYKKLLYKDLDFLMKKYPYEFTNFYIAKTEERELQSGDLKGNYHVVCFRKFLKHEVEEFLNFTNVDPNYLKIPKKTAHKTHVLRYTEKYWKENGKIQKSAPEFDCIYPAKIQLNKDLILSQPHYKFFKAKWKFEEPFKWQFDNNKIIELHKYSTCSKK